MNRCRIKDDKLLVYVDPECVPTTEFTRKWIQEYCQNTFHGDMITTLKTIIENKEFCIVFTPTDYIALADLLDVYLTYDLEQARLIIKWIHNNVRDPNDDSIDWATVYLEILEGAYSE